VPSINAKGLRKAIKQQFQSSRKRWVAAMDAAWFDIAKGIVRHLTELNDPTLALHSDGAWRVPAGGGGYAPPIPQSDVTNLVTDLAAKALATDLTTHEADTTTHGISAFGATLVDDADAAAARTTLGLGTAATSAVGDFEAAGAVAAHAAVTTTHGISAFGATLVDDADAAAARTTLGLVAVASSGSAADLSSGVLPDARMPDLTGDVTTAEGAVATTIAANAVSDAKLRDSAAVSVIGRSANSAGDPADIAATADGDVLRRAANVVGFGAIPEASVTNLVADLAALAASHGATDYLTPGSFAWTIPAGAKWVRFVAYGAGGGGGGGGNIVNGAGACMGGSGGGGGCRVERTFFATDLGTPGVSTVAIEVPAGGAGGAGGADGTAGLPATVNTTKVRAGGGGGGRLGASSGVAGGGGGGGGSVSDGATGTTAVGAGGDPGSSTTANALSHTGAQGGASSTGGKPAEHGGGGGGGHTSVPNTGPGGTSVWGGGGGGCGGGTSSAGGVGNAGEAGGGVLQYAAAGGGGGAGGAIASAGTAGTAGDSTKGGTGGGGGGSARTDDTAGGAGAAGGSRGGGGGGGGSGRGTGGGALGGNGGNGAVYVSWG